MRDMTAGGWRGAQHQAAAGPLQVPSPAERWLVLVCRAGSRGSLRRREQAEIPSHLVGVPLTWFGGALARCLPFPWRRAASPALLCLEGTEQELGQAMLELKLPEPDEEQLVLKGWCFCSIPRGGWKGLWSIQLVFANSCYFI